MYSRVFIIRFLFFFLFIFVLCLSSLTKSDIKEGAAGDPNMTSTPTTTNISTPTPTNISTPTPTNISTSTPTNISTPTPTNTSTPTTKPTRDMFAKDYSNPTDKIPTSKNKYSQDISKDINIEYHKPEDQLRKELDQPLEMTYVYDKKGNKILYPSPKIQGNITYHVPGSYPFGSTNYVPKYADSIFLSKSTGLSTVTTLSKNAQMKGGFCNYYKNNPDKLEEYCKKTDVNKCASTNCCVLLGGSTCVAGNENGPTNKAHYNNIYIRNKDYYYYQGKCYGNC